MYATQTPHHQQNRSTQKRKYVSSKSHSLRLLKNLALAAALTLALGAAAKPWAQGSVNINGLASVEAVRSAVQAALDNSANTTVTVTGSRSGVTEALTLDILDGKTVIWQAEYEGGITVEPLIKVDGEGTFSVADGAKIMQTVTSSTAGNCIETENAKIQITGGEVIAARAAAILITVNGSVEVTGGLVKATGSVGSAIQVNNENHTGNSVTVSGGNVEGEGTSVRAIYAYGKIQIEGTARVTSTTQWTVYPRTGATLTVDDGTIENASSDRAVIYSTEDVNIVIKGGTIKSNHATATSPVIELYGNSTLAIYGGKILREGSTDIIQMGGTSTLLISGDGIEMLEGSVYRYPNATVTAYYTGNNDEKFRTIGTASTIFTPGGNLHRLEPVNLTLETPTGTAYEYNEEEPYIGTVVAQFHADLENVAVSSAALHTTAGNTVTFAGNYNLKDVAITVEGTLADGKLPVAFTTKFDINIIANALFVNDSEKTTPLTSVAAIKSAIATALEDNNVTVTGKFWGATTALEITIPKGKTVTWQAEYEGDITNNIIMDIRGDGELVIDDGGLVENTYSGIYL